MATCFELGGLLRELAGLLDGLTLPIAAMAEWGLLGLPPDPGLGGLATPGFSKGVLAAPNALSNLPDTLHAGSCYAWIHCVLHRSSKQLQAVSR